MSGLAYADVMLCGVGNQVNADNFVWQIYQNKSNQTLFFSACCLPAFDFTLNQTLGEFYTHSIPIQIIEIPYIEPI